MHLTRDFHRTFERINDVRGSLRRVATTPPVVNTITFAGTLDTRCVPIEAMRLGLEIADGMCDPEDLGHFTVDTETTRKKVSDKRFKYQLPLRRNNKSLKLFKNGSVHATGCTSPLEFLDLIDAMCRLVHDTTHHTVSLTSFDIHLINAMFSVVHPVTRRPITIAPNAFRKDVQNSDFDTERHPSVKVPVLHNGSKVATVCVFQTGSVSIMGAREPWHVAMAYELICSALDASEACTADKTKKIRTTTARHPLTLEHGYPFFMYACCLPSVHSEEHGHDDRRE